MDKLLVKNSTSRLKNYFWIFNKEEKNNFNSVLICYWFFLSKQVALRKLQNSLISTADYIKFYSKNYKTNFFPEFTGEWLLFKKRCSSVVGAFIHGAMVRHWFFMMDPLSHFLFQPLLHDWCNKGRGMLSCLWDDAYKRTLSANWKE